MNNLWQLQGYSTGYQASPLPQPISVAQTPKKTMDTTQKAMSKVVNFWEFVTWILHDNLLSKVPMLKVGYHGATLII